MTLNIENKTGFVLNNECLNAIERSVNAVLESERFPYEAEMSLLIVDDDEIRAINRRFRKIDTPTDVLSFPSYDLIPGNYGDLSCQELPVYLGDIAVSVEKAKSQSEEYGHSLIRELAFLTVHSVLHLLGYDHVTDDTEMFKKQEDILEEIGISRH